MADDLETAQKRLARALVDESAPIPEGFDPVRVRAASQTLVRKKASEARRETKRIGGDGPIRRLARALIRSSRS